MKMECKICSEDSIAIFQKKILLKYPISYYQCTNCDFMQTDQPFWLAEAYENAITSLDIGILVRNDFLVKEVSIMLEILFPKAELFLDFAGGYGLFVRAMRDKGYDFFRQDIYCENLFAKHFDIKDFHINRFDVVTAFEVLEHLENPVEEIQNMLTFADDFIFSTDLVPENVVEIENWIYIAHETGQHIAFYTEKSLQILAKKFNKNYFHKGNLHIFTNKTFSQSQLDVVLTGEIEVSKFFGLKKKKVKVQTKYRESYQHRDYLYLKELLHKNDIS